MRLKDIPKEIIEDAIRSSKSLFAVLHALKVTGNSYNINLLRRFIDNNNIEIKHFNVRLTKSEYNSSPKHCKFCGKVISYEKRDNDFCNHSCAASYNNLGVQRNISTKEFNTCYNCGKLTRNKEFCSLRCKKEYLYKTYIDRWLKGEESGIVGTDNTHIYIRKYLFDKFNNSCELCGWSVINKYTNKVPLQIHHIDGDCLNNSESNLQLLCPNCHSLTENFGSRNTNSTRIDKRYR